MSIFFNPFETSKAETLAEKLGFKMGKIAGIAVKVLLFTALGCTIGVLFIFFALGKGFDKGLHEKKS